MRLRRSFLAVLVLAASSTACSGGSGGATTPDGAVSASVSALRENDLASFVRATMSPADYTELESQWIERRSSPPTAEEAQQFEEVMTKLRAKGAADDLYAELEPQLDAMSQQFAMMLGMLPMLASMAASEGGLTGADTAAMGLASKLGTVDVADREKLRKTLAVVTACARDLEVETLAELQALSFDAALERGGQVLAAAKEVLAVYGLSVDGMLDSVEVEVLSKAEGQARVQVSYDLFGTPQEAAVDLVETDGRWFPSGS
jgi:hypothetical protein